MHSRYVDRYPPKHTDLEAANEEIKRLFRQLQQANLKWGNAVEKGELTKRSLVGTIKSLQSEIRVLKGLKP